MGFGKALMILFTIQIFIEKVRIAISISEYTLHIFAKYSISYPRCVISFPLYTVLAESNKFLIYSCVFFVVVLHES